MRGEVTNGEDAVADPSNLAPASVVVFDFDGTLVSRDSFFDFAIRYCARRPGRLFVVAALVPVALLLALRSQRRAGSLLLWAMTVGSSTRRFTVALRRYARHTLPAYANEAVFAELSRHVQAGSRVVIATGTVCWCVTCSAFGILRRYPSSGHVCAEGGVGSLRKRTVPAEARSASCSASSASWNGQPCTPTVSRIAHSSVARRTSPWSPPAAGRCCARNA
jgi:hypothetical protein